MARFKRMKVDDTEDLAFELVDSLNEIFYVIEDLKDNKLILSSQERDIYFALDKLVELFTEISDYDFNMVMETEPLMHTVSGKLIE